MLIYSEQVSNAAVRLMTPKWSIYVGFNETIDTRATVLTATTEGYEDTRRVTGVIVVLFMCKKNRSR